MMFGIEAKVAEMWKLDKYESDIIRKLEVYWKCDAEASVKIEVNSEGVELGTLRSDTEPTEPSLLLVFGTGRDSISYRFFISEADWRKVDHEKWYQYRK